MKVAIIDNPELVEIVQSGLKRNKELYGKRYCHAIQVNGCYRWGKAIKFSNNYKYSLHTSKSLL